MKRRDILLSVCRRINRPRSRVFPQFCARAAASRIFLALASIAVCFVMPVGAQEPTSADDLASLLAAVEDRYRRPAGVRVRFEQRYRHRLHDREVRSRGTLRARSPDRVRLDFDDGRIAIANDTTLTVFEPQPAPGRYFEQPVEDSPMLPPIALLRGEARLTTDVDARFVPTGSRDVSGRVIELRPREASRLWDRAWLHVEVAPEERGRVHRMMIIDAAGNLSRFDFTAESLRARHRDDVFVFTPPAGATRVEI